MLTTAKEYLRQYENIMRRIRILDDRIASLDDEADCVKSLSDNDGMPHGSNIGDPTAERAMRVVDEKLKRADLKLQAQRKSEEILNTILKVDGVEQEVLYLRYIKLQRWEDICYEICLEWTQTHAYHNKGLIKVEKIIKTE